MDLYIWKGIHHFLFSEETVPNPNSLMCFQIAYTHDKCVSSLRDVLRIRLMDKFMGHTWDSSIRQFMGCWLQPTCAGLKKIQLETTLNETKVSTSEKQKKTKHQLQISYKSPTNLKKYSSSISFFISLVLQSPPFKAPLKDFSHSWRARGGGWPLTWDSHFPTVSGMDWKTLKYVASQVRQASLGGFPEDKPIWGQRLP